MVTVHEQQLEHAVDEVDDEEEEGVDVDGVNLPAVEVGARRPQIVAPEFEHMFDPEYGALEGGLGISFEDGRHTLDILAISVH